MHNRVDNAIENWRNMLYIFLFHSLKGIVVLKKLATPLITFQVLLQTSALIQQ